MDWGGIILLALAILGAGLMAGGVVAYRLSTRVGIKAFGAASVAVGITMWLVVAMGTTVSQTGGPSAPVVEVRVKED
jgi:hypothetical protein